jgi:hypothetical protein
MHHDLRAPSGADKGMPITATQASRPARPMRDVRRNRRTVGAAGGVEPYDFDSAGDRAFMRQFEAVSVRGAPGSRRETQERKGGRDA